MSIKSRKAVDKVKQYSMSHPHCLLGVIDAQYAYRVIEIAEQDAEERAIRTFCNVCGTKSLCQNWYDSSECIKLMFFENRLSGLNDGGQGNE